MRVAITDLQWKDCNLSHYRKNKRVCPLLLTESSGKSRNRLFGLPEMDCQTRVDKCLARIRLRKTACLSADRYLFEVPNPSRPKCEFNARYAVFHASLFILTHSRSENMHHRRSSLILAVTALFWLWSPFGNKPFCSGSFWRRVRQTHPKRWPEKNGK